MEALQQVDEKLTARKKPTQRRSRATVNNILDAARRLLKGTDDPGSSRLTTHKIAREAGISVGSLYQYFPNTEAVIFEVYREILETVHRILDKYDSAAYLSLPRDEFFAKLNRALTRAEPDTEIVLAMLHVSKKYPMLREIERQHAERTAERIAGFLKHFGSAWPTPKLKRLVLFLYYMDHAAWMYRDHVKPPSKEVLDWEVGVIDHVMMQCFD